MRKIYLTRNLIVSPTLNTIRLCSSLYHDRLRKAVITHLGLKCVSCGNCDPRVLDIDHINGGGFKEAGELGVWRFYRKVLTDTSGLYQLLCSNCNRIKKFENKENTIRRYSPANSPNIRRHVTDGTVEVKLG